MSEILQGAPAMKILLLYGSSQGQTEKIMQHLSQRLSSAGHQPALVKAGADTVPDIVSFDACILAASVHVGQFQKVLVETAREQASALSARPGLFLCVSLTAAGNDPAEQAELERQVSAFLDHTGWTGPRVAHVAGALRFSQYGFFEYWAMRWIARRKQKQTGEFAGIEVTGKEDIEFTDWEKLNALVDDWLASVADSGHH
jgi:menaquinone-dependent protoporphyrinogen oxidase